MGKTNVTGRHRLTLRARLAGHSAKRLLARNRRAS